MIGARWANAKGGGDRMDHPAHMQDGEEVTVPMASKALNVGERGVRYANVVIDEGTDEEIAAPQREPRKPLGGTRKPRREWQAPAGPEVSTGYGDWPIIGPSVSINPYNQSRKRILHKKGPSAKPGP